MGKLVTDQIEKNGAGALSFYVNNNERMSISDTTGLTVLGNVSASDIQGSQLTVTGNASLGGLIGGLTVSGNAQFNHNLRVAGNLESRGGGGVVENTSVGFEALKDNTTGLYATAVGFEALKSNTTGLYNTAVGWMAGKSGTTSAWNTAVGFEALMEGNSKYNVAIGGQALKSTFSAPHDANAGGEYNTAVGTQAMELNTIGYENVAVGGVALHVNTTGYRNAAVGYASMRYNTTGNHNTAMGYASLLLNTTGTSNCAFGQNAMERNKLGNYNTAIGSAALYFAGNTADAHSNTSIGYFSLYGLVTGHSNTAVGTRAGYNCNPGCTNSTFIGNEAGLDHYGPSGNNVGWPSNIVILGNSRIGALMCARNTITSLSDRRDKTNIVDIPVGLEFVRSLRPVSFDWNMRCGGKVGTPEFGFIAQDLQEVQNTHTVVPGLVDESNPDRLSASPGTLLPVLVKAIQELDKKLQELNKKLQEHIA